MKQHKFLLLILALSTVKTFSQDKGLIFWSDYTYYNNHEENYEVKTGSYLKRQNEASNPIAPPTDPSVTPPVKPPITSPVIPPLKPPTTVQPIPDVPDPKPPKPEESKYIFYNKVFYPGNNLSTGVAPIGGDLTVNPNLNIGMGSTKTGYTLTNQNTVTVSENDGTNPLIAMQGSGGGTIVNGNKGVINLNTNNSAAMSIEDAGKAINNGTISASYPISANTIAMKLGGTGIGVNNGTIDLYNTVTAGATVENGSFINSKGAHITGAARYGVAITGTGSAINEAGAEIKLLGAFSGMYIGGGGEATNNGTITIISGTSGMRTTNGTIKNNGTITMRKRETGETIGNILQA